MLASLATQGDQRRVIVRLAGSNDPLIGLNAGAKKVRALQWAGSNNLIITTSATDYLRGTVWGGRHEWLTASYIDLAARTQRPLIWGIRQVGNVIAGAADIRVLDGKPNAFAQGLGFVGEQDRSRAFLFKTDLDAGLTSVWDVGSSDTKDYVVGANGDLLARSEYDADTGRWSLDLWKGGWQEVQVVDAPIETPMLLGLGRDGASVLVDAGGEGRELKADGSGWGEPFPINDPERLIWDGGSYRLIGASALDGEQENYHFYAPADQKAWDAVTAFFPSARVELVSFTDDHKKFVVRVQSPTVAPSYFLADLDSGKTTLIGEEYAGLTSDDIAPVHAITFKAKDGLALSGYLTLPRGREAKKLPLIVFPHGGPAARDEPGFDWWSQAMASRGYAVLQVNFRGSDGFGWNFLSAGFGQWGRKMQTDLSDGVHYLATEGTIDPSRVCIVGASYGGYAALAGATLDPATYRCAASVAGPSDLKRMVDWYKRRGDPEAQRFWLRYMGEMSTLAEISPASHAASISIPILLVHGKDDTVVSYEQSQIMADALRKAGKSVEFVTLKGEDHWLSRGETRLEMLQSVVAFLEKQNPP